MIEQILLVILVLLSCLYTVWIVMLIIPGKPRYKKYMPPVSILIPAHNEEAYIGKTLGSVVKEYPKKEIIVIDDGSSDRTAEIVRSFSKRGVKLLRTNHKGKSAALNKGLEHAKYDIIIILDADSEIKKRSIEEIVKPLKDKTVAGATGMIRARKNLNPLTWFQDYEYIMSSAWRYASTNINGNSIIPGFGAFKKNALKKIGGFGKDTLTEDFDIVVELKKAGFKTITVNTALITTNVPQTFGGLIHQRLRWGLGTIQVIKKHANFIFSRKSGTLGYFTIPTQFYWYVHAFVYLPVILYMMLVVWTKNIVITNGYLSIEFLRHIFTMFSVYGIIDLLVKVVMHEYAATTMIILSLIMFFLSFIYTALVFVKLSRPTISILIAYVFFFPYSLFNLFILALSGIQMIASQNKENKWT